MALETKYIVGTSEVPIYNTTALPFPVIYRVIEVDGVEVSRGLPDFKEVTATYPDVIPTYYDAMRDFFMQVSTWFDDQNAFTADTYRQFLGLRRFVQNYIGNFDISIQDEDGFGGGDQRA